MYPWAHPPDPRCSHSFTLRFVATAAYRYPPCGASEIRGSWCKASNLAAMGPSAAPKVSERYSGSGLHLLVADNVTMAAPHHSRAALIFLIAAIAAALVSMPLLRAVGIVQWPVFVIAWLINLGAAWHLAQWARQQGRSAWAFGLPAALGTVASIVVYVLLALLGPKAAAR